MRSVGWENVIPHASKGDVALYTYVFHLTGQLFLVVVKGDIMIISASTPAGHHFIFTLLPWTVWVPGFTRVGNTHWFFYIPTRPLCLAFALNGVNTSAVLLFVHSFSGGVGSATGTAHVFWGVVLKHFSTFCYLILLSKVHSWISIFCVYFYHS